MAIRISSRTPTLNKLFIINIIYVIIAKEDCYIQKKII